MTEVASKLDATLRKAEEEGGWANYAVYCMGSCDSGSDDLNAAIAELYETNEKVHRIANQLALRYDVDFFEGGLC